MRVQTQASSRSTAVAIARAHMETLRAQDPRDILAEGAIKVDEEGKPNNQGAFTRTVQVEDAGRNLKEIRVYVDYPRSGAPIELMTYAFYVGAN